MHQAILQRLSTSDDGTFGVIELPAQTLAKTLYTLECPWRDNALGVSCIPPGVYLCRWHNSPRFGWVYRLDGTAPRTQILIHRGNWAGDPARGRKSDSRGCILLGMDQALLDGQPAILRSRAGVDTFSDHFGRDDVELTILPITPGLMP